jgi:hypothetical protein
MSWKAVFENPIKTRYEVRFGNRRSVVTSEKAARALARDWLGVARVYETPATNGWDLWTTLDESREATPVEVRVL